MAPGRENHDFWRGNIQARVEDLEKQIESLKQKMWWLVTAIVGAILTNFPNLLNLLK